MEVRDGACRVVGRAHDELAFERGRSATKVMILRRSCASGSDCDDGLFCNGEEVACESGVCVEAAPPCVSSVSCRVSRDCDEVTDKCLFVPAPSLDDADPCTDDVCTDDGPQHTSNVDDGDPCTDDACTAEGPRHLFHAEGCGMVEVPEGNFWMVCAPDDVCEPIERPRRDVFLSGFAIDRTEVTQGAYAACVVAGVCRMPTCDWDPSTRSAYPVICVDGFEASMYCAWTRNTALFTVILLA